MSNRYPYKYSRSKIYWLLRHGDKVDGAWNNYWDSDIKHDDGELPNADMETAALLSVAPYLLEALENLADSVGFMTCAPGYNNDDFDCNEEIAKAVRRYKSAKDIIKRAKGE